MSNYEEARTMLENGTAPEVVDKSLTPMVFQCGCRTGRSPSPQQIATDESGFVICAVHRVRRYGWASRPSHSMDGWTSLQVERFLIFGERPRIDKAKLEPSEERRVDLDGEEMVSRAIDVRASNSSMRFSEAIDAVGPIER